MKKTKPIFQVITLGDYNVGKTSILKRIEADTFSFNTFTTIGIDCIIKDFDFKDDKITLKIWDTAGQKKFHTITPNFYKQAQAALLVFDITSAESLEGIESWIKDIRKNAAKDLICFLIGNKMDLADDRKVCFKEATEVAESFNMKYFETSAYLGRGINEVILDLVTQLCLTHSHIMKDSLKLKSSIHQSQKHKKCC